MTLYVAGAPAGPELPFWSTQIGRRHPGFDNAVQTAARNEGLSSSVSFRVATALSAYRGHHDRTSLPARLLAYPSRPIRIIIPFLAGGTVVARQIDHR
jgi:hypothetical protein